MGRVTKLLHDLFGPGVGFELRATCIEKQRSYSREDLKFRLLMRDRVRDGGGDMPDFVALDQRKNFIDCHIPVTSFMAPA
ncbi:hypothetical protein WL76_06770 [Burkholderia ubonensis]|nr:hypothetical protein WL76_06770 [Burkholderia ubonensis]KWE62427.1 hypothetical protein WL77_25050 [Burkholderia ubonensis]KWE76150.1 hypothetical protein WL79_10370 [Burkholderia ubonensis]